MVEYLYPQVIGGDRFTMNQRITLEVGVTPDMTGDVDRDGVIKTVIVFKLPLTDTQKAKLDVLMADNPTYPPTQTGTKFIVDDIYARQDAIKTAIGITFDIYYTEGVRGSGVVDKIILQFPRVLTSQEKNKVRSTFSNLIVEG